jgi:hypothetical protein
MPRIAAGLIPHDLLATNPSEAGSLSHVSEKQIGSGLGSRFQRAVRTSQGCSRKSSNAQSRWVPGLMVSLRIEIANGRQNTTLSWNFSWSLRGGVQAVICAMRSFSSRRMT